jgi:hypothetical protein
MDIAAMNMKNIKLVHDITLLIKSIIIKNENIENLSDLIKEIKEDFSILDYKNYLKYTIMNLSGERFVLISPEIYKDNNDYLCFFIKIEGDYYHMLFKKETGIIFSLKQFTVGEYNRLCEIAFIEIEKNLVQIIPTPNSYAFVKDYEAKDCLIYSKLKAF